MRKDRVVVALSALVGVLSIGCERPPVGGPPPVIDDDRVLVDLPALLQDRPAIGGKWYEYSVDGHVLEPKSEAWILKAPDGDGGTDIWGFRIASVYDDDTGDSGLFTLEVVEPLAAGGWSSSSLFTAPKNVKDGAPVCVDLGTKAGVDCADVGWQLRFVLQSRLSVFAGFAVAEPAVFLAPDVVVARVDGLAALSELPDPATLSTLVDEPHFDTSDWDFSRYAGDLPAAGRVLGARGRAEGKTWTFVDVDFAFVRFTTQAVDPQTLRFSVQRQPIDRDDGTVPRDLGAAVDVDVDVSTLPVFVAFGAVGLRTPDEELVGSSWPLRPPFSKRYDLVIDSDDADELQLLLSPAAAALSEP